MQGGIKVDAHVNKSSFSLLFDECGEVYQILERVLKPVFIIHY